MLTMCPDVKITRRKNLIMITDEVGDCVWTGQSTYDAFEYMLENNQYEFRLQGDRGAIKVMIQRAGD